MQPSRTTRLVAALITMFSLLFAQLAVAAYACPDLTMSSMSAKAAQDAMPGCADMDMAQPGLCQAHCASGHQSLDTPPAPHVPAFVSGGLVAVVAVADRVFSTAPPPLSSPLLTRTTAPPLAIRHCCFRI
ncbi:hypothetical protein LJR289_004333 [Pseudoduganella sp. LjRoot289]|uniref:hypothetical protein n=1 Tax=Pseudoduganella sp. LjRoot289 TaxID=3342314 RepID=UPI003ECC1EF2